MQERFLASTEKEVLFSGGRGSGKSDCLIVDPLRYCHLPKFRGLIIRNTIKELRDLMSRAKQLYPQVYKGVKWKTQENMFTFPSGARIEFGYLRTEDDVEQYRGQEYTWLGIDEITQIPKEEWYDKLKSSLRSTDKEQPLYVRATTNPSGAGVGWVKERWINRGPQDTRIVSTDRDWETKG